MGNVLWWSAIKCFSSHGRVTKKMKLRLVPVLILLDTLRRNCECVFTQTWKTEDQDQKCHQGFSKALSLCSSENMIDFSVTCCSDRMNQLVSSGMQTIKVTLNQSGSLIMSQRPQKPRGSRAVNKLQSDRHGSILRRRWWCTSLSMHRQIMTAFITVLTISWLYLNPQASGETPMPCGTLYMFQRTTGWKFCH